MEQKRCWTAWKCAIFHHISTQFSIIFVLDLLFSGKILGDWNKNIKNIPRDGSSGMFPMLLPFVSKHAKGMSLRYDAICTLGIGDAALCETPCKRKSQSDWAQLGDKSTVGDEPRRGSVMIVKNRLISRPTLSEAHIVCTLLSPSYASLRARTLAWCFASFGISDACSCRCFSFPIVFPLSRNLCPRLLWLT